MDDSVRPPEAVLADCARGLLDSVLDATRVREMPQECSIEFISFVFSRDSPETEFESRWLKWDSPPAVASPSSSSGDLPPASESRIRGRFVRLQDSCVVYAVPSDSRDLSSEIERGDIRVVIPNVGARMVRTRAWREAIPDFVLRVANQWRQVLCEMIVEDDLAVCHLCRRPGGLSRCVACGMHVHEECASDFVEWADSNPAVSEEVIKSTLFDAAPAGACARAIVVGRPDVPGGGLPSGFEESWHDATCNVCEFLVLRASEEAPEEGG